MTERARALEKVALHRGGGDAVLRFTSDELSADPGRISDELSSTPLFGGEAVVSLRVLDGRHNVAGALTSVLERPPEASWLVVEAGELANTSPLRKMFEASAAAATVPSYHAEGADLASMIHASVKDAGLLIEPAALERLVEILASDRLASRGELAKLFLYVGEHASITANDVDAVVGDTADGRGDAAIDAALAGDSEALESALARLRVEAGWAASLAALTLRHLVQLAALRASVDAGVSPVAAVEHARPPVYPRRRGAVAEQLRAWPHHHLAQARLRLADAILLARRQGGLEASAISEAMHGLALRARRSRADQRS